MNLEQFLASASRNEWIAERGLRYYVRKSVFFEGVVELANCHSTGKDQLGFWRFLKKYESHVPFYAEQVINAAMAALFRRKGWTERMVGHEGLYIPHYASPLMVSLHGESRRFKLLFGD